MKRLLCVILAALMLTALPAAAPAEEDGGFAFHPSEEYQDPGSYAEDTGEPAVYPGEYAEDTGEPAVYPGEYAEDVGEPAVYPGEYAEDVGEPAEYPGDGEGDSSTGWNPAPAFETEETYFDPPVLMYVYTENGGELNVRAEPDTRTGKVIGYLKYGTPVKVLGLPSVGSSWYIIEFLGARGDAGYVMQRYLVPNPPPARQKATAAPARRNTPTPAPVNNSSRNLQELNRQLSTASAFSVPMSAIVRASRTSGWVNFRVGPAMSTDLISQLQDGHPLTLIGQTEGWYQAIDYETGKVGYIDKNYVSVLANSFVNMPAEKEHLGKLNVNGEFTLQCRLPEGYQMQSINHSNSRIIASITSANLEKPILYLSIAFNELYSNVARMNDLGQVDLSVLEKSFSDMNEVSITYRETAYGTKLMVVREIGSDNDFVDIFTIYRGYSIEFVMTPNPKAVNRTLSETQVQMCVDFLSELDFVAM